MHLTKFVQKSGFLIHFSIVDGFKFGYLLGIDFHPVVIPDLTRFIGRQDLRIIDSETSSG